MDIGATLQGFVKLYEGLEKNNPELAKKTESFAALCLVYTMLRCPDLEINFSLVWDFAILSFRCIDPDQENIIAEGHNLIRNLFGLEGDDEISSYDDGEIGFDCGEDHFSVYMHDDDGRRRVAEALKKLEASLGIQS